jgi:hypothetical protein
LAKFGKFLLWKWLFRLNLAKLGKFLQILDKLN